MFAEEAPTPMMEPIVVTASRLPAPHSTTSANSTVITREEIEARQPRTIMDLLRQVPGLHVDQPGGRGGVSSVYLRGSDPNFVVVLIDGIKMNDPTNSRGGSFDFSTIDPESVARIEIIHGPLTSVYGSDALGGVIHIITSEGGKTPETQVTVKSGTKDDYYAGLNTQAVFGRAEGAFQFSVEDDGTLTSGSAFSSKNVHGNLRFSPVKLAWLNLVLRYNESRGERFPDDSGGPAFAVLRGRDLRDVSSWTAGLSLGRDFSPRWSQQGKVSFYQRNEDTVSPGVAPGARDPFGIPPNRSDNRFERLEVQWYSVFNPGNRWQFVVGANLQSEKGESQGALDFGGGPVPNRFKADREVVAGFFETGLEISENVNLEGGFRVDDPEGFDLQFSPRLGFSYGLESTKTTIKANWSKGFKLPSFFALGHPVVGNASLVPETSRSAEAGVTQKLFSSRLVLRGTYFTSRYYNLIDLQEGPPPILVNRSEVKTEGFEAGVVFQVNSFLTMDGHISYVKSEIEGSDEVLRNRPKWRGGLKTRVNVSGDFLAALDLLYVGRVHDSSIPTGDRRLDDYVRVDLAGLWRVSENWQFSGSLDNVFDADYDEALGFPAPGIRLYLGLRYSI